NGELLDEQEDQLGALIPAPPAQRTYDLMPMTQSGRNVVSLLLTRAAEMPRVLAELEVQDSDGVRFFGSDEHCQSRPGAPRGWMEEENDESAAWHPCQVEAGTLDIEPRHIRRDFVQTTLPLPVAVRRIVQEGALILVVGLLAFLT